MKNVNKTALLPVVTVLAAAYTLVTNDAVSKDTVDTITNIAVIAIGAAINIWGIIKNHKEVK